MHICLKFKSASYYSVKIWDSKCLSVQVIEPTAERLSNVEKTQVHDSKFPKLDSGYGRMCS